MTDRRALCGRTFVLAMWAMMILTFGIAARAMAAQDAQQIPMSTQWGSVKSVSGNTIVMATDAGTDLTVTFRTQRKCCVCRQVRKI